ncbi:MAG: phosphoribosylanthranilate isomerase [Thermodesulfobacteriota bacterium]|nr:phosphoribosylanthranilate isomerase [Thermodesulfobacteriota bacterium]
MTRIKICGITSINDAICASECGADALGFVFYPKSPRHIDIKKAASIMKELPPFINRAGLFVNPFNEEIFKVLDSCDIDIIQLHGNESPEFCEGLPKRVIKAIRIKDASTLNLISKYNNCSGILLDTFSSYSYGGTGKTFSWDMAKEVSKKRSIILAGGLNEKNIKNAIIEVKPYGVDISSGVESSPGRKDYKKIKNFITIVRMTDYEDREKFI